MTRHLRIHWGVGIALIYSLFAIGTTSFVVFALGQPVDLVSGDYYERSLTYDEQLRASERAEALGDALTLAPAADGRTIVITIPASAAASARGQVTLYRPADAKADRTERLAIDAHGQQRIDVAGLPRGRWIVQLQWRAGERDYYREQAVQLP